MGGDGSTDADKRANVVLKHFETRGVGEEGVGGYGLNDIPEWWAVMGQLMLTREQMCWNI